MWIKVDLHEFILIIHVIRWKNTCLLFFHWHRDRARVFAVSVSWAIHMKIENNINADAVNGKVIYAIVFGDRGAERRSVYLFLHSTYVWSPSIRSDDKILFLFRTRVRRRNVQLQHWLHCRAAKSFVWCLILSHPSRWVCRMPGYRLATKTTTKVLGTSLPNWREKINRNTKSLFVLFVSGDVPFVLCTKRVSHQSHWSLCTCKRNSTTQSLVEQVNGSKYVRKFDVKIKWKRSNSSNENENYFLRIPDASQWIIELRTNRNK